MDYEYDVFISYRNKKTCKWWVENRFLPLFKENLEEAVGDFAGNQLYFLFLGQLKAVNESRNKFLVIKVSRSGTGNGGPPE